MIESLATIMSHFSGEANRARCLAHVVNLVAKIILHQFDVSKGKKKKTNDKPNNLPLAELPNETDDDEESEDEELEKVLEKEEKEMDEGDDEDDEDARTLLRSWRK